MITIKNEKFSDSFPSWLKSALSAKVFGYSRKGADSRNRDEFIAWDTAEYIPAEIPSSARSIDYKDPNKLHVFRIKTGKTYSGDTRLGVYIPGMIDPDIDMSIFGEDSWRYMPASRISYKGLKEITVEYGYILRDANSTIKKRSDRAASKSGSVDRDRKMGAHMGKDYYDKLSWHGPSKGYDKSGYKLDPYKYVRMLAKMDTSDTKSAARRIENLYNQIEDVRKQVVQELSKTSKEINANKKDKWSNSRLESLSSAINYISRAMREYEELVGILDKINAEKGKQMSDKEREAMKDWYSRDLVRVSDDCKDYIKYAKEYLNGEH